MQKGLAGLKRTKYCGEVSTADIGKKITLMGWAAKYRDLGGVLFIDLRDRSGIVQIVFNETCDKEIFELAGKIRTEYAIGIEGEVRQRSAETVNKNIKTGEIEVVVSNLVVSCHGAVLSATVVST